MGYYTRFALEIYTGDDYITDYEEVVIEQVGYDPFTRLIKWYEFEDDMKEVSKLHPKVVFELRGIGEEDGDLWKAYFQNGKMQMCKARIVYDYFDEARLE